MKMPCQRRQKSQIQTSAALFIAMLFLLETSGGCGQSNPYSPVRGTVTFQDKPVPNAVVIFEATQGSISVAADANEAGVYQARRSQQIPGLPPGDYRVTVTPPLFYPGIGAAPSNAKPPQRNDIPLAYREASTSGLVLSVQDALPTEFNIRLEPRAK